MPIIKKHWVPKSNVTSLIAHIPLKISAKEEWYFDSGCSRHMTGNKDLITGLHPHAISYVTFGDGAKGEIKGIGKLDCLGVPKLDKVLLVKGLTANLISISQLCDQGLNVNFTKTECLITNKESEVIMEGVRTKDNCYMWNSQISYSSKCTSVKEKGMKMIISARETPKLKVCGKCQTRMSHQKLRLNITSKGLKLLHMKLIEPMQVESLYGKKFAMVDDFSRYIWTKNKSDVVEIFKDCCLKPQGEKLMVAQTDVDNIGFGRRSDQMVEHVARQMQSEVGKSFVGLGLQVKQIEESIFLSQSKCAKNNVKKIGMKSARTPAPTHSKVFKDENGVCAIYQAEYIAAGRAVLNRVG